jgi:plasmid stabilization system protein ParE
MAARVVWSANAKHDLKEILAYWVYRNKSKTYSKKLNYLINKAIEEIVMYPKAGKLTSVKDVRAKIIGDYTIFFEEKNNKIYLLRIWDTRQNPERLTGL